MLCFSIAATAHGHLKYTHIDQVGQMASPRWCEVVVSNHEGVENEEISDFET